LLVILKNKSLLISSILNKKDVNLSDMEKSLFDISIKLISNKESVLLFDNIDFIYHVEVNNYMVIIKPSISNIETYNISFTYTGEHSTFIELNLPPEYTKQIFYKFNREVQKRMKKRQSFKINNINKNLTKIYENV
jgi:hypothetical protein